MAGSAGEHMASICFGSGEGEGGVKPEPPGESWNPVAMSAEIGNHSYRLALGRPNKGESQMSKYLCMALAITLPVASATAQSSGATITPAVEASPGAGSVSAGQPVAVQAVPVEEGETGQAVAAVPIQAQPSQAGPQYALPANTEIMLELNEELHTSRNEEGDTFRLSVASNVMLGDYVVIPEGTRAVGEITWITGKGMFGKSGKMDIALRYIDLNGQRIPIEGTFRQEGEGNTVATVAGVILVPIAGLFITGRSGVIPEGRELTAHTANVLPVSLPAGATIASHPMVAEQPLSAPVASEPAPQSEPTE